MVMFFVNPIKLRMVEQPVGPIESNILNNQEEHKLPDHLGGCWPIFHQISIVESMSKEVKGCEGRCEDDAVQEHNSNCVFEKYFPFFIVSFPRPRFLSSI